MKLNAGTLSASDLLIAVGSHGRFRLPQWGLRLGLYGRPVDHAVGRWQLTQQRLLVGIAPFTGQTRIIRWRTYFASRGSFTMTTDRRDLARRIDELELELKRRDRLLTEALEQQTATSEILRIISGSPTDAQPTFDAIAESATRLCDAVNSLVFRYDGELLHLAAHHNVIPERLEAVKQAFPRPADIGSVTGRVVMSRAVTHVEDITVDPDYALPLATTAGYRSVLGVPMLREGAPIGAIIVARGYVAPFSNKQIKLLEIFADQAVIAIENTRLFEAEQATKRELQESLEYQTATSEVLNVISRSPNDLQPVLDAIIETAARLCEADWALVFKLQHGKFSLAGSNNATAEYVKFMTLNPPTLDRGSLAGRVVLERKAIHIPDILSDPEYTRSDAQRLGKFRSMLGVPLLREGVPMGVFVLLRGVIKPFSDRQIDLVTTFADQAVIAIENTRLFEEVQARTRDLTQALEYQTATSDVLAVISRSKFDLQPIIDTIVETATRLCQAKRGALMRFEDGGFRLLPTTGAMAGPVTKQLIDRLLPIDRGSVAGRVAIEWRTVHILDLQVDQEFTLMRGTEGDDRRTCLGVPLIAGNGLLGALVLQRTEVLPFTQEQIKLVETFADQAVIAFENTRLFDEIVSKSRELEIASQHKSQFVANMSHELRTPLAAMLGYAELLQESIYGALPEKSLPILTRIRSNGNHLLGLINTILDISKIEAGQFKLNLGEYALGSIVETVMVATESLSSAKKLAFKTEVAKGLPYGLGDEQRLTQVLLNLVGNAIKFTDAGEVRIAAGAANGRFTVSVSDTGPGIPAEECGRVFEKFRQVDSSNTRAKGGTGLGLAIAREIVEMHGGRIWVESTLGQGSTFHMELPVRAAGAA